ncbi:MAG: aminodeoxychorismate/anthranilate synthase component II [SAR324 cluster bacterium]|nr:aminodeoxychorismate/anthranilate synthase component II [SAR324 cluster bacterium]
MILLIDNYDSFTFNLYQYLGEEGKEVLVIRNNKFDLEKLTHINPESIVISPGPGRAADSGAIIPLIKKFSGHIPILGVCLGHQAIAEAFGGKVIHATKIFHGKSSPIKHNAKEIFINIDANAKVGRYHSLMVDRQSLPDCLTITAVSVGDNCIMALQHKTHLTFGIQFHPESVLTPQGKLIIRNFLKLYKT